MSKDHTTPESELENCRIGYQSAVAIWSYEGTLIWSKFNAMLVANSVILAAYGFAVGNKGVGRTFTLGLPVAGMCLCLLWVSLTIRAFDNYVYWILSTRELEEKLRSPLVTVSRGAKFADGESVDIVVDGSIRKVRMSRIGRTLRAAWASYLIIAVFFVLYALLLL